MRVLKRDSTLEDVSFDKVLRRIRNLCESGTTLDGVRADEIAQQVCGRIYDGVPTSELDELAAQLCASLITTHPDYGTLAARIIVSNHHKNTSPSFSETMALLYNATDILGNKNPLISEELWQIVQMHRDKLNSIIDYARDYDFSYFGFKTLERSYLTRVSGRIVERPQHMWMRVALGIHGWDIKEAIETYNGMSQRRFTHATPTLFNAGTPRPQMSSCFLMGVDDSISGIYKNLGDCALISKTAGGIGIHVHNIRGRNSYIRGTNGKSSGIIPMLRVFNETAKYVNQSGRRNGSIAVYMEPWHTDIEAFLDIRKNHGNEDERCRDLFTAMWIPDLFMKTVQENGDWYLMCPDECPGLPDSYGEDFEKVYASYVQAGRYRKKVKAQQIWLAIIKSQIETGTPYILFKDHVNRKSNQKNQGVIKSSNLCVAPETLVLTDQGHVPIKDICDQQVNVWNGHTFSEVTVRQTGVNQELITVHFSNDRTLRCTPYHKFYIETDEGIEVFEAKDLKPDMMIENFHTPGHESVCIRITKIETLGEHDDTYCFNEPLRHRGVFNGVLTGQCSEIVQYSDHTSYASCNLASISLPAFVRSRVLEDGTVEYTYDFEELQKTAQIVTRNINKVIDRTYYPVKETEINNKQHRPLGIGVTGLADTFAMMRMPFDSEEAARLNVEMFEAIYYGCAKASMLIAKRRAELREELADPQTPEERREDIMKHLNMIIEEERLRQYPGAYSSYEGSPAEQGQLQFDLWGHKPSPRFDWAALKADISKYGLRNSLFTTCMPSASTSQIIGNNESIEPFTSNAYTRETLAGNFNIINKYLVADLIRLGLWNDDMKNRVLAGGGSIADIPEIPQDIKALYKTAWELKMRVLIDQSADRGPFICQSQSLNLFMEDADFSRISNAHFYSWKRGLKTACYYLRTRPKAKMSAYTLDANKNAETKTAEACRRENPEACLMCSA